LKQALEIALLSEPFDAATALRLGIVNRVVVAGELVAETAAIARKLAEGPTQAYCRIKRLLRNSLQRSLREQLDAERQSFAECAGTADFSEGVAAFFEKRPPKFTGR
jgi:2-(1,2-epoxy-1,2-dihydrophenyl)acetyl-CoA isomerase